jgi:hypothetical protein
MGKQKIKESEMGIETGVVQFSKMFLQPIMAVDMKLLSPAV